jgi:hypothetical protein
VDGDDGGAGTVGRRKQFFFEKKNQKTFFHWLYRYWFNADANGQKFLLLFSKRSAFLSRKKMPCPSSGAAFSVRGQASA